MSNTQFSCKNSSTLGSTRCPTPPKQAPPSPQPTNLSPLHPNDIQVYQPTDPSTPQRLSPSPITRLSPIFWTLIVSTVLSIAVLILIYRRVLFSLALSGTLSLEQIWSARPLPVLLVFYSLTGVVQLCCLPFQGIVGTFFAFLVQNTALSTPIFALFATVNSCIITVLSRVWFGGAGALSGSRSSETKGINWG